MVKPVVIEEYVDKGLVRFVSRHFAFLGTESIRAAEAAECAAEQQGFEEYSHLLLVNQRFPHNSGGFGDSKLVALAGFAGFDETVFTECLRSGKYMTNVLEDLADAEKLGVPGTPSVFVNGEFVSPADLETVRAALDRFLVQTGGN